METLAIRRLIVSRIETINGSIAFVQQEDNYAIVEIYGWDSCNDKSYAYTYLEIDKAIQLRDFLNEFIGENND